MAPSVITTIVFVALVLNLTLVIGLRCHCDFCRASKNSTCETNGFCLSLTWLQRETGTVHHAYRCLHIESSLSRELPVHCNLSNAPNVELRTACCNTDMCNLHLTPTLQLPRDPFLEGWYRRPRTGTFNITGVRARGFRPAFNFTNSTEQQHE